MSKLLVGLIAAFILGALVALPFTSATVAAEEEEKICCFEAYGPTEYATRAACEKRKGEVVETNRCEPEKETVCCIGFYGNVEGFMSRKQCTDNAGDVASNDRCTTDDAVADRVDAANVEGARDIGDVPRLSADPPDTTNLICDSDSKFCECDEIDPDAEKILGKCDGIEAECDARGSQVIECTSVRLKVGDIIEEFRSCKCTW